MSSAGAGAPTGQGLPRMVVVLVGLAAALLVVAGLRGLAGIIGPVFLAFVLTIATQPVRLAAERRGIPGWAGAVVALLLIYAGLIGLTVALTVSVARFATLLPSYEAEVDRMRDSVVDWLGRLGVGEEQIQEIVGGFDLGRLVELAGNLVSGLLGVLSSLFLVITLVLFMVADAARFSAKLRLLPASHEPFTSALTGFGVATRRYIVVSTVFGLIVAVLDTVALMWLGVPVAVLWGLLSFITNYIPNIGFVIGVVPPAIIGLLEGGPRLMISVLVVYSVLNVVIQSIIQPKIVGDTVGLSATLTMISLVFWAYTLGAVGALLAVPLTLFAKALLVDADARAQWLRPLMSGQQATSAPMVVQPVRRGPKGRGEPPPEEGR
ncbi:MAG TPA: AI-2E family transporter [Nocardioidaceae bacterium]|nr:AI-2E family transporter [Nocardioidaceae bacterium]